MALAISGSRPAADAPAHHGSMSSPHPAPSSAPFPRRGALGSAPPGPATGWPSSTTTPMTCPGSGCSGLSDLEATEYLSFDLSSYPTRKVVAPALRGLGQH